MRTAKRVITTTVFALAVALGPAAGAMAMPQSDEQGDDATAQPGVETTAPDEAATATGTAQDFPVGTGFGRLFGTTQLSGDVQVGYRFVSVGGSDEKYREQYDIDDGIRILNTRLVISPERRGPDRTFDRITLSGNGLGGDPYETWSLAAYKTGAYRADVRYRSADYFYGDPGDVHAWDTNRKYLDVGLSANIGSSVTVHSNFGSYRRTGETQTTRDFDRDEFHFEQPMDQEGTDYGFGIRWNRQGTSLFFDQQFVNFRDNSGFTSGPNAGGPTATFIEMLSNTEVRAMDAPISRGGFHTLLMDNRVEVFGDLMYSDQQTSSAFVQLIDGINRGGNAANTTWDNQGLAERTVTNGNLEARFRVLPIVVVVAKYRHRDWDQDGNSVGEDVTVEPDTGDFADARGIGLSSYQVKGDQIFFGAEVMPLPALSLFGELGYSSVLKQFDKSTEGEFPRGSNEETDVTTKSIPFRIGGFYRPDQRVDVKFTYSHDDVDDPLTQVFPTVADGLTVRGRYRPGGAWTASADFTYRSADNDLSAYEFDSKNFGAALAYTFTDRGHASVGYSYLDSSSSVPFRFVLDDRTEGESVSAYDASTNVFRVGGKYQVTADRPLDVYGSLAWVDNSGTLPLSRWDVYFGGRYQFDNGIFVDGQVRFIDYAQELFHEQGIILSPDEPSTVNNFDATLVTLSLGFAFD